MSSSTDDPTRELSRGDDGDAVAARRRAGLALRAAREAAGRELPQLAAQLKVAPAKLQALEEGDWTRLPDATFARALLRGACKALRIDPQPLLDLLPPSLAAAAPNAATTAQAEAATRAVEDIPARPLPRGGAASGRHHGWWWLAVLILIAAAVVYFWPAGGLSRLGSGENKTQPASHPVAPPASATAPQAASRPVASAPSAPTSSAAAAASAPAKAASSVAGGGTLSIQTSAQSWVQVTAQGGKVLFSQLVQPGPAQTVTLPAGSAPLSVVVGNAPQTTLTLNGQPVDLAPATRGNVARLTLP